MKLNELYWRRRSSEFFSCTTRRLTFLALSKMSRQLMNDYHLTVSPRFSLFLGEGGLCWKQIHNLLLFCCIYDGVGDGDVFTAPAYIPRNSLIFGPCAYCKWVSQVYWSIMYVHNVKYGRENHLVTVLRLNHLTNRWCRGGQDIKAWSSGM